MIPGVLFNQSKRTTLHFQIRTRDISGDSSRLSFTIIAAQGRWEICILLEKTAATGGSGTD